MKKESLFEFYINNTRENFSGWDFSYLTKTDRLMSSPLSYSYLAEVNKYIHKNEVETMLDMGTGGGEFLAKFIKYPPETYTTEGYEPNIPIAKKRLKPLGIDVVRVDNDQLNFEDNFFDLVINRHESYLVKEIKRVLSKDGIFITQQVGSENCLDINRALNTREDMGLGNWHLNQAVQNLKDNGFEIIDNYQEYPDLRFYDIGALIYYLKAVPWQVSDFSIEKYKEELKKIHNSILKNNYFEVKEHRFFLIAKK